MTQPSSTISRKCPHTKLSYSAWIIGAVQR